jgi:hypothetical protein
MPLPAALKKKAPKAKKKSVMAATMHDLKHGPHHGMRTHAQEVAIGLKQSGQSKGKNASPKKPVAKADKPNGKKRKRPRNKGRQ